MVRWQQLAGVLLGVGILSLAECSWAADAEKISWHTDLEAAWKITQQDGRPLLVFVTHDNCFYCEKMKGKTYADLNIATEINQSFVPLTVDGKGSLPLLKELNVTSYPTTFIISQQAVVLDRIVGYVTPEALATRLAATRPEKSTSKLASTARAF